MADTTEASRWVRRWSEGDDSALEALLPLVYADLRAMARRELRGHRGHDTLQPTALVNDVLLKLIDRERPQALRGRAHLFHTAARMMRQMLVDRARGAASEKHGGGWMREDFARAMELPIPQTTRFPELDEALNALTRIDARMAEVVELRYFIGLSVPEVAAVLQVDERTVYRDWASARAWLRERLGTRRERAPPEGAMTPREENADAGGARDDTDALEARALDALRTLLALAPHAREDALARLPGPALARRVRRLLAHVDEAELDAAAPERADADADTVDLRFGPYRARRRIGRGGMGEVFRAERDDGSYLREVAIKRMWSGLAPLAERFVRERHLLARLQHPNIAQLLDGGIDERGQPWLAMELVRGEALHRWCDARRAPLALRVRLLIQLCRALDHAHRNLIVHRDIKPGNVWVDEEGNTKLLDFGIARLLGEDSGEHTQSMTPAWSTPEQRAGAPATTASDLYQLGLVMRCLLSGRPPQPRAPRMSRDYAALTLHDGAAARAIADARGCAPEALTRALRGDLDAIVALATAEDPAQRYPSASAFGEDLERWLDRQPVRARADERGYRLRRALRRYWPAMAAAALGLGFVGYHLHSMNAALERVRTERERALAAKALETTQRRLAEDQRDKARVLADYFGELFDSMRPSALARGQIGAHELLQRGLAQLSADGAMPPATRSELLIATGNALGHLSRDDDQQRALGQAIALLRAHPQRHPDELAHAYSAQALASNSRGAYEEARAAARAGLALYEKGWSKDPVTRDELRIVDAMLTDTGGDRAGAAARYRDILRDTRPQIGRTIQLRAVRNHVGALTNLAQLEKDPEVSERLYREALTLNQTRDPTNLSLQYVVRNYLIAALLRRRDYDAAEPLAEENLRKAQAYYVDHDSWLGIIYTTAAKIDMLKGRYARAAERFDTGAAIVTARLGEDNPIARKMARDTMMADFAADRLASAERKLLKLPRTAAVAGAPPSDLDVMRAYLVCARAPSPATLAAIRGAYAGLSAEAKDKYYMRDFDWPARCERRLAARR